MSKEHVTARVSEGTRERLNTFADDEGASASQALEKAASRGLEVYGYGSSDAWHGQPPIARVAEYGTLAAVSMAAALGGVHLATVLSMLGPMTVFLVLALVLLAVRTVEPRVSTLLFRRGEQA